MSKLSDVIGQFATVPYTVIKMMPQIGEEAFALWVYLRYRTNGETGIAFPSYNTIHAETGLHPRKIARALRRLSDLGLVIRHKRFGRSTEYVLVLPEKPAYQVESTTNSTSGSAVIPPVEVHYLQGVQTNQIDSIKIDSIQTDTPEKKNTTQEVFPFANDVIDLFPDQVSESTAEIAFEEPKPRERLTADQMRVRTMEAIAGYTGKKRGVSDPLAAASEYEVYLMQRINQIVIGTDVPLEHIPKPSLRRLRHCARDLIAEIESRRATKVMIEEGFRLAEIAARDFPGRYGETGVVNVITKHIQKEQVKLQPMVIR